MVGTRRVGIGLYSGIEHTLEIGWRIRDPNEVWRDRRDYGMTDRDEFPRRVVIQLAARAGHNCSNPNCRRPTSGPDSEQGTVNIGAAAHISAAAPGGPRFDSQLTSIERSAASNGIWLCQSCAKLIDSDPVKFTPDLLLSWKESSEARAQNLLQFPQASQSSDGPALVLPSTDVAASWLTFSARATTFVGRDAERAQSAAFLGSNQKMLWWLVTGPAGAGKSRFALELCRNSRPAWNAGFLSRTNSYSDWSGFRPLRPTLIVIDYAASRVADVSDMVLQLSRSSRGFPYPVRVLLLERDLGTWWHRFHREDSETESTELLTCQYDEALRLGPLTPGDLRQVAAEVARMGNEPWTESRAQAFEIQMRTIDPGGRPLFGMMVAGYSGGDTKDAVVNSGLLRRVLRKEAGRRRQAITDPAQLRKIENLVFLATLVGGLVPQSGTFSFLEQIEVASLLPDPALLDSGAYCDLIGGESGEATVSGLQPDILGERFVLDRINDDSGFGKSTARLTLAAWVLQPDDFCEFVLRAASDFPGDTGLDTLCHMPLDSASARSRWGQLIGDLVRLTNRSADEGTRRLLHELRQLADKHQDEVGLQTARARAEFYLGNIYLFSERNYGRASAQFDTAIALAGGESDIKASAINNRGILHAEMRDEDKAFADFSDVIDAATSSDEARACSLNNRVDIFVERGTHEDAIRDRSRVLALTETSPDRRYIALARRSRSYCHLGRVDDALQDLLSILKTDDIAPEQKAEALIMRSRIFTDRRLLENAKADLEAVASAEELFPGGRGRALVGLAEVARLEQNSARAREYLDLALRCSDTDENSLIELLIVSGRLSLMEGDTSTADGIWQKILANENASARQKAIAEGRGVEPRGK